MSCMTPLLPLHSLRTLSKQLLLFGEFLLRERLGLVDLALLLPLDLGRVGAQLRVARDFVPDEPSSC